MPIYVGDDPLTTFGGTGQATTSAGEASAPGDRPTTIGLSSIFASSGTPVYIGGRGVNCPEDQPDC